MKRSAKFWILFAVAQAAYGLAIFAVTRAVYLPESAAPASTPAFTADSPRSAAGADTGAAPTLRYNPFAPIGELPQEAVDTSKLNAEQLSQMGNRYFLEKQYPEAARYYELALQRAPREVELYNNLGLSLHYLGRSVDAIDRLKQGIQISDRHQRIWLTLGFVQAQIGRTEESKGALQRAVSLDPDSDVGREASNMLSRLP